MQLAPLIDFYQGLSVERLARFPEHYAADVWFKDPFNEVRGVAAVQRIFSHMFRQVAEPHFVVTGQLVDGDTAMLVWEFHFRSRLCGWRRAQVMHGVSHLRFDADGKVDYHRDYWDTGEELYLKLPGLGLLMRGLRHLFRA